MTNNRKKTIKPRIPLSSQDIQHLAQILRNSSMSGLAKEKRLPYLLVYNVVHGRVKTISERHYRMLFGKPPPPLQHEKVDGRTFRKLVRLWLFLNDELTRSAFYRQLFGPHNPKKPDLRIFSGHVRTVDPELEDIIRRKFAEAGVDRLLLNQWMEEFDEFTSDEWVPYDRIRPVLRFLQVHLGAHPTRLLNRTVTRYESGALKRVSRVTYNRIMALKRDTEKALESGELRRPEKLRESAFGGKEGYTLYADIQEELDFLRKHIKKSARGYLGRSSWVYDTGKSKRVADWRARKILKDTERYVREREDLPISALPGTWRHRRMQRLLDVLKARVAQLLSRQEGILMEKRILRPAHTASEYKNRKYGLTQFDMAPGVLGMKREAFDLMVANNCDIFRAVGIYTNRWYLSDLYLRELSHNRLFTMVSAKYESLTKTVSRTKQTNYCMN